MKKIDPKQACTGTIDIWPESLLRGVDIDIVNCSFFYQIKDNREWDETGNDKRHYNKKHCTAGGKW